MAVDVIAVTDAVKWDNDLRQNVPVGGVSITATDPRKMNPVNPNLTAEQRRKGVPGEPYMVSTWGIPVRGHWENATDFRATLRIVSTSKRGSLDLLDDATQRYYTMFPTDFIKMIQTVDVVNTEVTGKFGFTSRSGVIGIEFLAP